MKKIPAIVIVLGGTLVGPQAPAHHSFGAEYDVQKPITLTGVLTKIEWTNPHTHIYLDVKDEQGKVVNWQLEGYPPVALHRIGWKRDVTMKVGDTLTVTGWRARDGGSWGHSREITLPSGEMRQWLEDGDRLTLTGWCEGDGYRVGFGEVSGRIVPAG